MGLEKYLSDWAFDRFYDGDDWAFDSRGNVAQKGHGYSINKYLLWSGDTLYYYLRIPFQPYFMKKILLATIIFLTIQPAFSQVKFSGAMSEMGKLGFAPSISLDSLKSFRHLIALGPLGKMEGEITVLDGKMYGGKSSISGETVVVNNWNIHAPFLVYADVQKWKKIKLTGKVESLTELEAKIKEAAILSGINLEEPFFFRIKGNFDQMITHIVTPRSQEIEGYVAGQNQRNYDHQSESGELIGVYSKTGQRIYTHHDSFIHVHFLSKKKDFTGHLDKFQSQLDQLIFYFPKERVVRR